MINLSKEIRIPTNVLNKHMVVGGATGTGKTVTLQKLTDEFNKQGIAYMITDIKGDVSAGNFNNVITLPSQPLNRLDPDVVAKLLDLNNTQASVLKVVFKAEPEIYTWEELRTILQYVYHKPEAVKQFGLVSSVTVAVILRQMMNYDETFMDRLFTPTGTFNPTDLLGKQTVMDCRELVEHREVYASIMIGMIDTLYTSLPEAGDLDKPKLVLIIDEAHMLFNGISQLLLDKITQRIRLIRSKGVSVVFASQSSLDIPEDINAQIATRIQHGVRIYTEKERVKATAIAKGFDLDYKQVLDEITNLGIGEVVFKTLDGQTGIPTQRVKAKVDLPRFSLEPRVEIYRRR